MENFIILFFVVVILLGPLLYFFKYYNPKEEQFIENLERISAERVDDKKNDAKITIELVQKINSRYLEAKKNSQRMLVFAIMSLVVGGLSFYFAANIASNDELRREKNAKLEIESKLRNKFLMIYSANQHIDDLASLRKRAKEESYREYSPGQKKPATDSLERLSSDSYFMYQDSILLQTAEIYSKRKDIESSNIINSTYFIFTTISIRILIAFLTFYFAQLFLKLYNYYTEVSDFYINRADAMLAYEEGKFKMDFKELTSIFEHNKKLGIGPKSPLSAAIDIINATKKSN